MNNKSFILIIIIAVIVAGFSLKSYFSSAGDLSMEHKVSDFPMAFGEWKGTEEPLREMDYEILETHNMFLRKYENPKGDMIYLFIVYSEDNRKVSHPPEVCLTGAGVKIEKKSVVPVTDDIKANKLIARKDNIDDLVLYWYKAGPVYTDNYMGQQLKVMLARTFGKRTPGAMIRLTTPVVEDEDKAFGLAKEFTSEIQPLLEKYVP